MPSGRCEGSHPLITENVQIFFSNSTAVQAIIGLVVLRFNIYNFPIKFYYSKACHHVLHFIMMENASYCYLHNFYHVALK